MIEVGVAPDRLIADCPTELTVRLTNVGAGTCTNIIFKLALPSQIRLLRGNDRIQAARLDPGQSAERSIRVLPKTPGGWYATSPNFSYRDQYGTTSRVSDVTLPLTVAPATVVSAAPEPAFTTGLTGDDLPYGEWGLLRGWISNTGQVSLRNVVVRLAGPVTVDPAASTQTLGSVLPGARVEFSFYVRAEQSGDQVPVHIMTSHADQAGRSLQQRQTVAVRVSRQQQRPHPHPSAGAGGETADAKYVGAVVVLTALELEHRAMQAHLTGTRLYSHPAGTLFDVGSLTGSERMVALASTGSGNQQTAILAERAIAEFKPAAVLCVGIAGAIAGDLRLGDVVVATKIYGYHGGREDPDGFKTRPQTWHAPHRLDQLARHVARADRWTGTVHFRPVAAGDVVLNSRDSPLAQQLDRHYNDAAAIEMESAGLAQAGHLNGTPLVLTIRGISDRADGRKYENDRAGWQAEAAKHAAEFAADLCRHLDELPS